MTIPTGPNNILDDLYASLRNALGENYMVNYTPTPGSEGFGNFTFTQQGSEHSIELILGLGLVNEATGQRALRVQNNDYIMSNTGGYFYDPGSSQGQIYDPYDIMGLMVERSFKTGSDYRTPQEIMNAGIYEGMFINQQMRTPQFMGTGPLNSPEQRMMMEQGRLGLMTRGFVDSQAVAQHLQTASGQLPAHLTYLAPESGQSPAVVTPSYFGAEQIDAFRSMAPVDAQSLFKRSTLYGRREVAYGMVQNPDGSWSVAPPTSPQDQALNSYRQSGVILPGHLGPHAGIQTQAATFDQGLAVSPGSSVLDPRGLTVDRWAFASPKYGMPVPINEVNNLIAPGGLNFAFNNDIVGKEFAPHTNVVYGQVTQPGGEVRDLSFNTGPRPWIATQAPYLSIPQGMPNQYLTTLIQNLESANINYQLEGGKIGGGGAVMQAVIPGMGATSISLKSSGGKNVPQGNVIPDINAILGGAVPTMNNGSFQVNNIRNWKSGEWSFINALAGMTPVQARSFLGEFAGSLPQEQSAIVNAGLGGTGPVNLGNIMSDYGPTTFQNHLWNFVQQGIQDPTTNARWLQDYRVGVHTGTLNLGYYDANEARVMQQTMRQGALDVAAGTPGLSEKAALAQLEQSIHWINQDDGTVLLQQTGRFFTSPILERPVPEMLGEGTFSPTHISSLRASGYHRLAEQLGASYTMDPTQALNRSAVLPDWWHMMSMNKGFGVMGRGGMAMPDTMNISQDQMWDLMNVVSDAEAEFADLPGNHSRAILQRVSEAWNEMAPRESGQFRGIGLGNAMQIPDPAAALGIDVEDPVTGRTVAHQSTMWLDMFRRVTGAGDDPSRRAALQEYYGRQFQFSQKSALAKNFSKLRANQGLAHRYFASPQATANNVYYSDEALMSAYGHQLGIPEGTEDPYQHDNFKALKTFIEGNTVAGFFARDPNLDRGKSTTIPSRLRTRDSLRGSALDRALSRQSVLVGSTYDAITIGDKDADQAASFFPIDISFDDQGNIQFAGTDDEQLLRDVNSFQSVDAFQQFARDTNELRFSGASDAEKRSWGLGDPFRVEMQEIIGRGLQLLPGAIGKEGSRMIKNSEMVRAAISNASHQMGMGTAYNLFLRGTEASMSEGDRYTNQEIDDAVNNQMMQYQQVLDATRGQTGLEKMMSSTIFTEGRGGKMGLWFTAGGSPMKPQTPQAYLKMLATELGRTSMMGNKAIAYALGSGSENTSEILSAIEGQSGQERRKTLHGLVDEGTIGLEGNFPRIMLGLAAARTEGRENAGGLAGLTFGGQTLGEIRDATRNLVTGYDFIRGAGVPGLRDQIEGSEAFGDTDIGKRYRFMLAGMGLTPAEYPAALQAIAQNELMYAGKVQQHYVGGSEAVPFAGLSVSQISSLLENNDQYGTTQRALIERALGDPYLPDETRELLRGVLRNQPPIDNEHIRRGNRYEAAVTRSDAVREAFGLDVHTQSSQSFFVPGLQTPGGLFRLGTTGGHTDFMGFDRDDDGNITGIRFIDTKSYSDRDKIRAILQQEDHPGYHNVRMQQLMNIRGVRGQSRDTLRKMLTSFYKGDPRYSDGVSPERIEQEVEALKNPDIPADPYALLHTGGEGDSELAPLFGGQFDKTEQQYLEEIESNFTGPTVIQRIKGLLTGLGTGQAGPFGLSLPGGLSGHAGFAAGQDYLEGVLSDRLTSGEVDPRVRAAIARRATLLGGNAGQRGGQGTRGGDLIPPISGDGGGNRYGGYGMGYFPSRPLTPSEASEQLQRMQNVHQDLQRVLDTPGVSESIRSQISELGWGFTDEALEGDIGSLISGARGIALGDPQRMRQLNDILGGAGGGKAAALARQFYSLAGGGKLQKAFGALAGQDPDMDRDFLRDQWNIPAMEEALDDQTVISLSASKVSQRSKKGLTSEQMSEMEDYAKRFQEVFKSMTDTIEEGNKATTDRVRTEKYLEADLLKKQAENLLYARDRVGLSAMLGDDTGTLFTPEERGDAIIKDAQLAARMKQNEKGMIETQSELDAMGASPMRQIGQFIGGLPQRLMSGFTLMQLQRMGRIGNAAMTIGDDELAAREGALRQSMLSTFGGPETPWLSPQARMDRQRYMMSSGGMANLYNVAGEIGLGAMAGDVGGAAIGGLTFGTAAGYLGAGAAAPWLGLAAGVGMLGVNMYGHASRPADSMGRAASGGQFNEGWLSSLAALNTNLSQYLLPQVDRTLSEDAGINERVAAAGLNAQTIRGDLARWNAIGQQPSWISSGDLNQFQMMAPVTALSLTDSYQALGAEGAIMAAGRALAPGTDLWGPGSLEQYARAYGVAGEEGRSSLIGFGQRMRQGITAPSQQFYADLFDPYQTTGTQRLRRQALLDSGIHAAFDPGTDLAEYDRLANLVGGAYGQEFVGMTQAVGTLMDFEIGGWGEMVNENPIFQQPGGAPQLGASGWSRYMLEMAQAGRATQTVQNLAAVGASKRTIQQMGAFTYDPTQSLNALQQSSLAGTRVSLGLDPNVRGIDLSPSGTAFLQQQTSVAQSMINRGLSWGAVTGAVQGVGNIQDLQRMAGVAGLDQSMIAIQASMDPNFLGGQIGQFQSLGIAGNQDITFDDISKLQVVDGGAGMGLYQRGTFGFNEAGISDAVFGQGWEDKPDPYGIRQTLATEGFRGLRERAREHALGQAGIAGASAQLSFAFTTGVGLDAYKTVDPRTGKRFDIPQEGAWGLQERQMDLGNRQQMYNFAYQEQQMAMQSSQFYANLGLGREQQLQQRGWTMDDWAYQDQSRAMQWGWQQEDFQENVRFMTGRERRIAERQMGRATITHGMESERIDEQRSRQEQIWENEDKRFELTQQHHEEQMEAQEERLEKMKEFYQESKKLQEDNFELSKAQFIEQNRLQKAAASTFGAHMKAVMEEYEEYIQDLEARLGLAGSGQTNVSYATGVGGETIVMGSGGGTSLNLTPMGPQRPSAATTSGGGSTDNTAWQRDVISHLSTIATQQQTINLAVELKTPWGFQNAVRTIVRQELAGGTSPTSSGGRKRLGGVVPE